MDWTFEEFNLGSPVDNNYITHRISDLNIDIDNANFKTLQNVTVVFQYVNKSDAGNGQANQYVAFQSLSTFQSSATYYMYADADSQYNNPFMKGYDGGTPTNLDSGDATEANFSYTYQITPEAWLSGIHINASTNDPTGEVDFLSVEVYDLNDSQWHLLTTTGNPAPDQFWVWDTGGVQTYSIGTPTNLWKRQPGLVDHGTFEKLHSLYLSSRGQYQRHSLYTNTYNVSAGENFTQLRVNVTFIDTDGDPGDGLGFVDGWRNDSNTQIYVKVDLVIERERYIPDWGIDEIEVPEGFISGFAVYARMFEPEAYLPIPSNIPSEVNSSNLHGNISYSVYDLEDGSTFNGMNFYNLLARSVRIVIVAEDSLVSPTRSGDLNFQDNLYSGSGPLVVNPVPYVNVTVVGLDVESFFNVTVSVAANQALRNYYLNLTLPATRGYIGDIYMGSSAHIDGRIKRVALNSSNPEVVSLLSSFPSRAVVTSNSTATQIFGQDIYWPETFQIGTKIDMDYSTAYKIEYIVTFHISLLMLEDWLDGTHTPEAFVFNAMWDRGIGTYKVVASLNSEPSTNPNPVDIIA